MAPTRSRSSASSPCADRPGALEAAQTRRRKSSGSCWSKKKTCGREAHWDPDRRIVNSTCMGGVHLLFGDNLYNFHSLSLALSCITQSKLHSRFLVKIFHAPLLRWICATSCTLPTSCWVRCGGSTAHATAAASHVDNAYPNKSQVSTILRLSR